MVGSIWVDVSSLDDKKFKVNIIVSSFNYVILDLAVAHLGWCKLSLW